MKKSEIIFLVILLCGYLSTSCASKTQQQKTSREEKLPQSTFSITAKKDEIIQTSKPTSKPAEIRYIGNKNTKKFHRTNCYSLPAEKNRVLFTSRENAVNAGYSPCGNCMP